MYVICMFVLCSNIKTGVDAITCFLHACRHQHESKSRKYLARVIWLLTYDDEKLSLAEAVDKYSVGIQPLHWLPWYSRLLFGSNSYYYYYERKDYSDTLHLKCYRGTLHS